MKCESCGKEVASFQALVKDDEETLTVCHSCFRKEEAQADYIYERMREGA
jgi:ribosome-binding protein aMBF1 (putative translation factor)